MTIDPTLGLVVVGYQSVDEWEPFFNSLKNSNLIPGHVVIVDNSPPGALPIRRELWNGLRIVRRADNPGYGTAINAGASELPEQVTHVVLSNPDIRFFPDTMSRLKAGFSAFSKVAATGPALINPDGSIYPSARAIPGVRVGIGHALLGNVWPKNPWTRRYLGDYQQTHQRPVGWLSGALLMVARSSFEKVGGFDEEYFMFVEDVDLCFRAKKSGWRSLFVPNARLTHSGAHSTGPRMAEMVNAHHTSMRRFLFHMYEGPLYWPIRQVLRVGLWLRSTIARLRYRKSG